MKSDPGFFKGKNILVTGASGFIGSSLCYSLKNTGARIRGLSRAPHPSENQTGHEWLRGDIRDRLTWQKAMEDIDIVFHLAGQTSASYADQNPDQDYELNVLPVHHLIESANQKTSVLFAATATQYGIPTSLPVDETHPDHALSVYDQHKQAAEKILLEASRNNKLKACSLRLCNIYGPGPAASAPDRGVLNQMIARAVAGKTITLFQNTDCLRDFLYLEDCVQAFIHAAAVIHATNGKAYLIGSGEGHSIADAAAKIANTVRAEKIRDSVNISQQMAPQPLMTIETRNFIACSARFMNDTGWKAHYSLDQGIASMLKKILCAS